MLGFVMLLMVLGEYLVSGVQLEWWSFETPYIKNDSSGAYNWCNVTPTRIQIDFDQTFVVLPRDQPGVPFSLGVVPLQENKDHPGIAAFPNWGFNELGNCSAIQNAVDIELTLDNWLWVLDTGLANNPWHNTSPSCPPKLLKFKSFENLDGYDGEIMNLPRSEKWQPSNVFLGKMLYQNTFAYILDANNANLSIVNVIGHELDFTIHLSNGDDSTSIQNMALVRENGIDYFYFTYSGSNKLRRISTHELRDPNFLDRIVTVGPVDPKISFLDSDHYQSIIFRISDEPDVYKWNIQQGEPEKFLPKQVDIDSGMPTAVALDSDEQMWVIRRRSFKSGTGRCSQQRFELILQEITSSSDPKSWCNMTVTGMHIYGDQAILALPRNKPGVPFSLGVMPLVDKSPIFNISVFPRWDAQEPGNCNTIQNASDIKYTADGWLWVLDAGITNSQWDDTSRPCPPNIFKIRIGNDSRKRGDVQALNPTPIYNWQPSKLFMETSQEGNHIAYILDANNAILSIFNVVSKRIELNIRLSNGDNSTSIQNMALVKKFDVHYLYFTYSGSDKLRRIGTHELRDLNYLNRIITVGPLDPTMSFLGSDNNFIFFNYKDQYHVYKWDIIKRNLNPKRSINHVSGIPSAVALDSNGQIWGVRRSSSSSQCFQQKIERYSI